MARISDNDVRELCGGVVMTPRDPETISVKLDGDKTADLGVIEFQPYEPSAYCWDPGWVCYDLNDDTEYFVSVTGDVYKQPENKIVGVAPDVKKRADEMEAGLAQVYEEEHSMSWKHYPHGTQPHPESR